MSNFELYENKSSLKKSRSRMLSGGTSEIKGNKIGWWERKPLPKEGSTDREIILDEEYAGRPDLVAFDYLGTSRLMWLVLQYNNIVDLNEEFILGTKIVLPSAIRANTLLTSGARRMDT